MAGLATKPTTYAVLDLNQLSTFQSWTQTVEAAIGSESRIIIKTYTLSASNGVVGLSKCAIVEDDYDELKSYAAGEFPSWLASNRLSKPPLGSTEKLDKSPYEAVRACNGWLYFMKRLTDIFNSTVVAPNEN